ncbi:hypothetical protein [Sedimentitalea todarodis]|uniref:Uncharacterized protein n=1 Tax=Sedimentitalea todarodis TaxID=1631240 RepID=A0ABU3VNA9_9RHOB|nr:hypothetical protein [Sedimentitalea todarodis]MDU9007169.1 hypothetical protein [Sedimentitalea todarodis]
MLYKDLISIYGSSLAGKSAPKDDPVWSLSWSEDLQVFREYALAALQQAKVYLLDHLAASYADTLHDSMQENSQDDSVAAMAMLGEVSLPERVTWVEFEYRALVVARFERASPSTAHYDEPVGSGVRGYLIDNRNSDHLRVAMFSRPEGSKIMDPICSLLVNRTAQGGFDYDNIKVDLSRSMVNFRVRIGDSKEKIEALRGLHLIDTGADLFIPFALFAMLVSPDLGGIIPAETDTFTAKDTKTARKFGKSWILGAQKSHLTIRIGPQAAAHMREKQQRLEFERQSREERSGPVRHWVSEHERRYRDGKVVLVKGHHRGHIPDPSLPTRVMGPKPSVTDFDLTLRD